MWSSVSYVDVLLSVLFINLSADIIFIFYWLTDINLCPIRPKIFLTKNNGNND